MSQVRFRFSTTLRVTTWVPIGNALRPVSRDSTSHRGVVRPSMFAQLVKFFLAICLLTVTQGTAAQDAEVKTAEAKSVPTGTVTKHTFENNPFDWLKLYREYYVYVPAQYDGSQPAALMVFQDGHIFADPETVKPHPEMSVAKQFDKLIDAKRMPVTIAIMVNPGHIDTDYPDNRYECSKRSEEYDELSDRYVTFLIDELIPEVAKEYRLTDERKLRAIAGFSSGGVCAFTAAWQRPDYFHRVMAYSGSFVNIRGGNVYPYLVRSTPKKDLKVYLQSGSNDLDIEFGNWWLANQQMASALAFKGYDYQFKRTTGRHGEFMPTHFEEALIWLWKDTAD